MGITLWQHYINQAGSIEEKAFDGINSLADWQAVRKQRRSEFLRSMGLESLAPVCALDLKVLGEFKRPGYLAKKIVFQILPQCRTSATYYIPHPLPQGRLPAVLYTCGHSGSGVGILQYHPRAAMWARRGYAAMVFDTIEQHDAGGDHHGTYYRRHYDWISLGYTGAGGELWNSLRALDALAAQPEVDPERIGVTGISGGGAHSFFLAIADERIKAVAACCGVTMPRASIEDRHLQGHCDCMYVLNRFRRCTSEFAALIAPRPLLFCYASEDVLFSRREYLALAEKTRRIFGLFGAQDACALFEYPGPHGYKPETFDAINDWFDRHVSGKPHHKIQPGESEIDERDITVFNGAPPPDNKMRLIPEMLSPSGSVELPLTPDEWPDIRKRALSGLRSDVLGFLDASSATFESELVGDWIESIPPGAQAPIRRMAWRGVIDAMELRITALARPMDSGKAVIAWCDQDETAHDLLHRLCDVLDAATLVVVEGRAAGANAPRDCALWDTLRAGALIGLSPMLLTLQDMKLVLPFLRSLRFLRDRKLFLYGRSDAGVAAFYHAAFDGDVAGVIAENTPASHRDGAYLPGVLRVMDVDQAAGLAAPRPVALLNPAATRRIWLSRLYKRLGCPERCMFDACLRAAAERIFAQG